MFSKILSYICIGYANVVLFCILYLGVNFYLGRGEKSNAVACTSSLRAISN